MRTVSSYGVELRKQNIPIRQTLDIYRSAVSCLIETGNVVSEHLAQKLGFHYCETVQIDGKQMRKYKVAFY